MAKVWEFEKILLDTLLSQNHKTFIARGRCQKIHFIIFQDERLVAQFR